MRKYSVPAIAAGIAISVAISAVLYWMGNVAAAPREPWPFWYSASKTVGETLLNVLPGVAAGWIAGRAGVFHGAAVAVGITLAEAPMIYAFVGADFPFERMPAIFAVGLVTNLITQTVGGVAGETLRLRWRPSRQSSNATLTTM